VRTAELDVTSVLGNFDTRLSNQSNYERRKSAPTSQFNAGPNGQPLLDTSFINTFRLEQPLSKFGSILSSEFRSERTTTNNAFNDFSKTFPSALSFNLRQPLWRGRRIDEPRRCLLVAKRNLTLTDRQFRQKTIEIIAEVQRRYWDLSFALKNLQVQQESLRETEAQLANIRRRVEKGELAPVETAPVERQAANLEAEVYRALTSATAAQNNLKNLIVKDESDPLWNASIMPSENSLQTNSVPRTLEDALRLALANRVEIEQNTVSQNINKINRAYLRDQTKPRIDLNLGYTLSGFAGQLNENRSVLPIPGGNNLPTPEYLTGNYLQSLENLGRNRFNTFNFGITLDLPLQNRTAKSELGKNLVEEERLLTERRKLLQQIQSEVRNAWTNLKNTELRLDASQEAKEAAEREYESETRKFAVGREGVTTYTLSERQKQVIAARREEAAARADLNKAVVELERMIESNLLANTFVLQP
jgi:outer membrane protein